MLDNEFLEFLEYKICKKYEESEKKATRLWCKSVTLHEPNQNISHEFINDKKHLVLKAFVGKFGIDEYKVVLNFGDVALNRIAKKIEIKRCIPSRKTPDLIAIDFSEKTINIQLE
ncbi:hypothetical protein [Flavobacterium soli]|uniref:hypothetical protein n=1 Tax=Flavobacterium soli TaxID=344881 RepID=UPI0004047989|nr:hypothetical protein [Flavobacterium soli]